MRMKDSVNEDWMKIPSFYLEKVGGVLIFYCNYDLKLLELNNMPVFHIDILKTWAEIQGLESNLQDQHNIRKVIIWNNKNITIVTWRTLTSIFLFYQSLLTNAATEKCFILRKLQPSIDSAFFI